MSSDLNTKYMENPIETPKDTTTIGAFADLPTKILEIVPDYIQGNITLEQFLKLIKGKPGGDNFFKRLRRGTKVNVLRSSGAMDTEGWIIDPSPKSNEPGDIDMIRVHNIKLHLAKSVNLVDLIKWNI